MAKRLDIKPGQVFGYLTYLRDAPVKRLPSGQRPRRAICLCEHKKEVDVLLLHLVRGRIVNCRCSTYPQKGDLLYPIYRVWTGMNNRCKENYFQKQYYFDKGVSVCTMWRVSFRAFRDWALSNGYAVGLQIDRKNNRLGYSPGNCHFVTQKVNLANRDITVTVNYKGENIALSLLCERLGYDNTRWATIYNRIKRGWEHEKAFDTPTRQGNYKRSMLQKSKNLKND